ncbi:HNH endonuclease [Janthinobacterium sp. TB1-E2]|uniref:HNH endonuclease n=1 Tax=Janthinobacterium aestuarii TaxID=2985511 RepID=A0ABZ2GJH5_9BURK|nr:HNH endonuclease [Janthinobacterium lividum]EZP40926.1 HNH endonuclease [Janthinobacterium lividum]
MKNALRFTEQIVAAYTYTVAEQSLVDALHNSTLGHDEMWSGSIATIPHKRKDRDTLKTNIKKFLELAQDGYCYYCGFSFVSRNGERGYKGIQRDHIAPKSLYKQFTFQSRNLILACSKCNSSDYKGDTETVEKASAEYDKCDFNIIHPYLDKFSRHLQLQDDGLLKLVRKSRKGKATKKMFGLDETFEVTLRSVCLQFDKYQVNTLEELLLARISKVNISVHK